MKLDAAAWRKKRGIPRILDALSAKDGMVRYVGGAVRDELMGYPVSDIDLATRFTPEEVIERLKAAKIKAVPTGIAHGTITAVADGQPVEVTTLRSDVSTDGRRATVEFSSDWKADAARRDFTMNALYADPLSGDIHDFFGGLADLEAKRVRFIGEPLQRIAEDHLRILRFFRFHARYGEGEPDAEALGACSARANDLMALSRERIADEMVKILRLPDPKATIALMIEHGIFVPVLPEIRDAAPLEAVIKAEIESGVGPDPYRRMAALLPRDSDIAREVASRLKLSNKARKRLALAASDDLDGDPMALAYWIGQESAVDRLLLAGETKDAARIADADIPRLPISGGQLVKKGLTEGPAVAKTLRTIEKKWVEQGFPSGDKWARLVDDEVEATLGG